ncbi:MAG: sugar phosphate nucleotidyltransferase [Gemmatimonadota bacterium]|nr:sugar phosphate nucleotidyltransferase [Gemmatimonadota bacterium]
MQAIIPLAGKGTRVRPHTHSRPKPLLRVANRPVLSYVVETLAEHGVDEIIAITGHLAPQIEEYLAAEHGDVAVRFVEQVEQRGTADAIGLAEPYVDGPVLILFVDTLFDADFDLIASRPQDDGIIWAKEVEDYQRYGVVVTDEDGYMTRIVEKPTEPISKLANIGVYFVRDHGLMFEGIHHVMDQDPHLGEYFLTDAFQYMIDRSARLYTAEVEGWFDVGKPETWLETNRVMLERGFGGRPEIPASVTLEGPVGIDPSSEVEDARLGPNVSIAEQSRVARSRVRNTIIGAHSVVEDCVLADSIVGDHTVLRGVEGEVTLGDHSEVVGYPVDRESQESDGA